MAKSNPEVYSQFSSEFDVKKLARVTGDGNCGVHVVSAWLTQEVYNRLPPEIKDKIQAKYQEVYSSDQTWLTLPKNPKQRGKLLLPVLRELGNAQIENMDSEFSVEPIKDEWLNYGQVVAILKALQCNIQYWTYDTKTKQSQGPSLATYAYGSNICFDLVNVNENHWEFLHQGMKDELQNHNQFYANDDYYQSRSQAASQETGFMDAISGLFGQLFNALKEALVPIVVQITKIAERVVTAVKQGLADVNLDDTGSQLNVRSDRARHFRGEFQNIAQQPWRSASRSAASAPTGAAASAKPQNSAVPSMSQNQAAPSGNAGVVPKFKRSLTQ